MSRHQLTRVRMARREMGAATLMVVMVLFFVMSLVAAYASRNVIFEQRTSANQFESTAALEAAEAGLQWALGMVNGGRITDDCELSTDDTLPSFRQRYLNVNQVANGSPGYITVPAAVRDGPLWPICWFDKDNNRWVCRCPSDPANPGAPAASPTTSYTPSFRIRFVQLNDGGVPSVPSMVRVEVMGCTRFQTSCLTFPTPDPNLCRGTVCGHLAMSSGLRAPPGAALSARGDIMVSGVIDAKKVVGSNDPCLTVLTGGNLNAPGLAAKCPPQSAAAGVVSNDAGIASLSVGATDLQAGRMFAAVFGNWPSTYRQQPAAVIIDCSSTCASSTIRDAVRLNPGRVFIADGNVTFNGGSIGSAAEPIALVINGQLSFSSATDVYGVVFVDTDVWTTSGGPGKVIGALVAQNQISGSGSFSVVHDREVLDRVRWATGSFVVPPGGWRDFP